jgi:hypothetical protein
VDGEVFAHARADLRIHRNLTKIKVPVPLLKITFVRFCSGVSLHKRESEQMVCSLLKDGPLTRCSVDGAAKDTHTLMQAVLILVHPCRL